MVNIGTLLIFDDITDEKKREAIIQKNRNFIMLGEMAAFLVHEVRNSLGVIFGYTRTIDKEVEKIEKVNKEIIFLTEMIPNHGHAETTIYTFNVSRSHWILF